jgi:dihydroorotate dehydrogenase
MLMLKVLTLEKISLLLKVQAARDEMQWGEEGPPPLLVKIAPDLSKEDLEDIAAVSMFRFMYFFSYLHLIYAL